jgi:uncharacterized membrane protein
LNIRELSKALFSFFFAGAGILHFINSGFYVNKIPESVPGRLELVIGTGIFEIVCALGAAFRRTRRLASLAIMTFLLGVIPLNVYDIITTSHNQATFDSVLLLTRVGFLSMLSYWAYHNAKLY